MARVSQGLLDSNTLATILPDVPEGDTGVSDLQKTVLALLLKDLSKRQKKEDEEENTAREARKQGALAMKRIQDAQELLQRFCSHKKENGQTYLVAQRDHRNSTIYLCQSCQKMWRGHESLPPGSRLDPDKIGGPIY